MFENTKLKISSVYKDPTIVNIEIEGNGDRLDVDTLISLRGIPKPFAREIVKRFNEYNDPKQLNLFNTQ